MSTNREDGWDSAPLPEWYEQDLEEFVDPDPEDEEHWNEASEDPYDFSAWETKGDTAWMRDAECAKEEYEEFQPLFFGDLREGEIWSGKAAVQSQENDQQVLATQVCEACPVREMCLRFALENDTAFGAWGGTSQTVRHKFIKMGDKDREISIANNQRREFPCPNCGAGTKHMSTTPQRDVVCGSCGFSWNNPHSAAVIDGYYVRRSVALIDRRKKDEKERATVRAKKQRQMDDEIERALERRREQLLRYAADRLDLDV